MALSELILSFYFAIFVNLMAANVQNRSSDNFRMKGLTIVKPFVFGNVARAFTSPRADSRTHEWTLYVKPYYNEDFSVFIKKVQFKLHESYPNFTRDVFEPPYEINETGWGEFETIIKIFFIDSIEKPVTLYHIIRLFPMNAILKEEEGNLIVSEFYDEIVINEPTITFYRSIENTVATKQFPLIHNIDCNFFLQF
ncbi:hypothetical protein HZS_1862 [Henneguya salminicola]|nr:hypothetical protein HZS_1862 [Henneguya salminicola]